MTKKKLHEGIAGAMEALYAENVEAHCGMLAEHYMMSENFDKAAYYSRLAGKKAEKTVSLNDAIEYTKKTVACLERLPQTEASQERLIDARTALGLYMFQLFHITEAKEAIEPIFELALSTHYQKRIAQIYNILAVYDYYVEEDYPKAFDHFEKVLEILEKTEDATTSFFCNAFLGIAHMYCCDFDKALHYYRKALDVNVATNSLWGVAVMKGCLGQTYGLEGKLDKGYQATNEALRLAEQSGDMYSLGCAHAYHAMCCHFKGHLKEAKQHHLRALEFDERIDNRLGKAANHSSLGSICLELGEYQKARDHFQKATWITEENSILPSFAALHKIGFSLAKVLNNEDDIDLRSLLDFVAANKLKLHESLMRRYIGEILMVIDDQHLSDARSWIEGAIETDRRNAMRWHLGRDYLTCAELYKREGDPVKARTHLNKAIGIFKECGADVWGESREDPRTKLVCDKEGTRMGLDLAHRLLAMRMNMSASPFPATHETIALLKTLYSKEEAWLVGLMPNSPATAKRIASLQRKDRETVEGMLLDLSERGLVFDYTKRGEERFMMMQGITLLSAQYKLGEDGPLKRKIARMNATAYKRKQLSEREMEKMGASWNRIIPVEKAISSEQKVYDYEDARQMINSARRFAVGSCHCRKEKRLAGEKALQQPAGYLHVF